MSEYFSNFPNTEKSRYEHKLHQIGLTKLDDPLLKGEGWVDDVTRWSELQFGQIYVYLIESPGLYTRENLKAYKSLEAYNQFYSGWVHTCYLKDTGEYSIIKANLNRSQVLSDKPHEVWVALLRANGTVVTGHCTCMAGLGEVCSHVAALLFKVEACTRLGFNKISCTSIPCQWNQNFTKKGFCGHLERNIIPESWLLVTHWYQTDRLNLPLPDFSSTLLMSLKVQPCALVLFVSLGMSTRFFK